MSELIAGEKPIEAAWSLASTVAPPPAGDELIGGCLPKRPLDICMRLEDVKWSRWTLLL